MKLSDADFLNAAADLRVPVAAVKAVAEVESRGSGFLPDGRPTVLFERHIMFRRVRDKLGLPKAEALAKQHPDLISTTPGGYLSPTKEPDRMGRAADLIDRDCALESASWGAFQIMGFHWKTLGYARLQDFVNAMYRSEAGHLDAFVRFIKANPALVKALREQNWPAFARGYNGPAFAVNKYDTKLAAAFNRHSLVQA